MLSILFLTLHSNVEKNGHYIDDVRLNQTNFSY